MAAIRAAQLGMKTAVVEKDKVGGRCLNYACIPAKAVLRVGRHAVRDRRGRRVRHRGRRRDGRLRRRSARAARRSIKTLTGGVAGLFKKNKIDLHRGRRRADRPTATSSRSATHELDGGKAIVLATGSVPQPIPGTEFGGRVIGTEEAWALDGAARRRSPSSAPAPRAPRSPPPTRRLGTEVLLFEALDRVLPTEDADISKARRARRSSKQGIEDPHGHARRERRGRRRQASRSPTATSTARSTTS